MPENIETKSELLVFRHRYKWTLEEKLVLAGLGVGIVAVSALWATGTWSMGVSAALLTLFVFMFAWGVRVGTGRKNKSKLTAEYYPSTQMLTVMGRASNEDLDDRNTGSLRNVRTAGINEKGINKNLVLGLQNGKNIIVPQRIGKELKDILVPFLEKRGFTKQDAGVKDWVEGLETYNR